MPAFLLKLYPIHEPDLFGSMQRCLESDLVTYPKGQAVEFV
jgi:hypothetical protein